MSKYFYIKSDFFNVPIEKKVLDEKGLRELFLTEEIECLKNSIGDKESLEINLNYVKAAIEDSFTLEKIFYYLEDFDYQIGEIDERTFYQFFNIAEVSHECSIRTNNKEKKDYIEFLKDIVKTMEKSLKESDK